VSRVLGFFCARDAAVGVGTLLRVTGQFPAESTYTTGLILGKDTRAALIATFFARTMVFTGGRGTTGGNPFCRRSWRAAMLKWPARYDAFEFVAFGLATLLVACLAFVY